MARHASHEALAAARELIQSRKRKGKYIGAKALKAKLERRGGVRNPGAIVGKIARRVYGKAGAAALAAEGRRHG